MRFEITQQYAAPPERVYAAMTEADAVRAKYGALGHTAVEFVAHTADETGARVHTRRVVPLDVPAFARRFLSPATPVEQVDDWEAQDPHGVRHGTWSVSSRGVPVQVTGTLELGPDGTGSRLVIAADVRCRVPIVGAKLAEFVAGTTRRTIAAEHAFTTEYLAGAAPPKARRKAGGGVAAHERS